MFRDARAILWVTRVGDDGIFARMVADRHAADGAEPPMDGTGHPVWRAQAEVAPEAAEIRVAPVEVDEWEARRQAPPLRLQATPPIPLPSLRPGDVVVARETLGAPDGEAAMVRLCGAKVIGHAAGPGGVQEALVATFGRFSSQATECLPLAASYDFDANAERARSQPNSALVVAYRDGDRVHGHVLAHTGAYLFWQVADLGYDPWELGIGQPEAPGVYVLENGTVWTDHGSPANDFERDSGIDGPLVPATVEQIAAWGFDEAKIMATLRDDLGLEWPEGSSLAEALSWVPDEAPAPGAPRV